MTMSVKRHVPVTKPISVSALAEAVGVSRTRIYSLVRQGRIKVQPVTGGFVILPDEANRIMESAIGLTTKGGRPKVLFASEI